MYKKDFMTLAIEMAKIAFNKGEVPVGAVITHQGNVISQAHNKVIANNSVSSHAEILAINNASQILNNYRLLHCDIYVTLEPCHMCAKAIVDARLEHLYFGALEPKTGAIQSIDFFLDREDLNHHVSYSWGHKSNESSELLKSFFYNRR